jgi:peptidase C39-like protein
MPIKNQIFQTHKFIIVLILLAVLLSAFGKSNRPVARAQQASTSTALPTAMPTSTASVLPTEPLGGIPLYSGLEWEDNGLEARIVTYTDAGDTAELTGHSFLSEPIVGRPNRDTRYYYSAESLSQFGWQFVTDSIGVEAKTVTYFSSNQYLTVEFRSCDNQHISEHMCLKVWISSPDIQAPIPRISSSVVPQQPEVNASITYANPLPVPALSQNDPLWQADRMGFPDSGFPSACDFCTLGYLDANRTGFGCFVTAYAMLYDYYKSGYIDPKELNTRLNTGSIRFANNGAHCNSLMPGGSPYAPAGVSRGTTHTNMCEQTNCIDSANVTRIQNEINAGRPLLAVVRSLGTSQHMVVITGYSGNTYYINDPWDGGKHTLSSNTGLGPYVVTEIRLFNGIPPSSGGGTLNPPTLISPSGTITVSTPTYTWNKVNSATHYYLSVARINSDNTLTEVEVGQGWYESSAFCTSTTCSATPPANLSSGNYTWWIKAWKLGSYAWSSGKNFSVGTIVPPGTVTQLWPIGAITNSTPTYQWNKVNSATWYYMEVYDAIGTLVIAKWYAASSCGSSVCSVNPGVSLRNDNYTWWIVAYNSGGYGPWSSKNFSLTTPGFDSQFNGSAAGWQVHSGSWYFDSNQWYTTAGVPYLWDSISYNATFSDLDYQASIWLIGNGPVFLDIRGTPTPLSGNYEWDAGYSFGFSSTGNFSVFKSTGGSIWYTLQSWTFSSAIIQGGAWNILRVIAQGNNLYFYINGNLVWYGIDSSLPTGRVGFEMFDVDTGDQLWIDWATLSTVVPREITDTISTEQQALNEGTREGPGNRNYLPGK